MRPRVVMVLCAAALVALVSGCDSRSPDTTAPAAAQPADSARQAVQFSAEVASQSLSAGDVLQVRLILRNASDKPLHWSDYQTGLAVSTEHQADQASPDGMYMGVRRGGSLSPARTVHPLTLAPGETTSTVYTTGVTAATWHVVGYYYGDGQDGESPTITLVVKPRRSGK